MRTNSKMKKLVLILICLFVNSCDEPEKKPKTQSQIKQENHLKMYKIDTELSIKVNQISNDWKEKNQIPVKYWYEVSGQDMYMSLNTDILIKCSPMSKELNVVFEELKELDVGDTFGFSQSRCEVDKNILKIIKESLNKIKTMNTLPEDLYYFTSVVRDSDNNFNNIGFFSTLENCKKYRSIYSDKFNKETLDCVNHVEKLLSYKK